MSLNGLPTRTLKIYSPKPTKKRPFNNGTYTRSLLSFNDEERNGLDLSVSVNNPFKPVDLTKQMEDCSLEEMEQDFCVMKTKSEVFKSQRELFSILNDSTNPNSVVDESDCEKEKERVVERVDNPFEKNFINEVKDY